MRILRSFVVFVFLGGVVMSGSALAASSALPMPLDD